MNILFFDLECANCFNGIGKVCEFGAVLVDSNFNLINKYSYFMSPGKGKSNRFDKGFCNEEGQLQWAYDPQYYFQNPEFTYYYSNIKHLLENKNTLVFGYAVNNDCNYLNDSVLRYHLPFLHYNAYDLLPIIQAYSHDVYHGLENTYHSMCKDVNYYQITAHLAVDDALMTMEITKHLCKELKININQLINKYPTCKLDVTKYVIEMQWQKKHKRQLLNQRHLLHKTWHKLCDKYKVINNINDIKIALADSVIHSPKALNKTINKILELKYIPCLHYEKANWFIVSCNEERTKLLKNQKIKNVNIITLHEFWELTN